MIQSVLFTKYSGCGNDFIIIDNRAMNLGFSAHSAILLCDRNYGIGGDGVILLEHGVDAPYRMRIFNADGSEAEMCGNGLRCLASFIFSKEGKGISKVSIETISGLMQASINEEDYIKIFLPTIICSLVQHELSIKQDDFDLYSIDTGVPHTTFFVDDIEDPRFMEFSPLIRNHEVFQPRGTNVNIAKIETKNSLSIRTYERGIEKETLACGTGAIAVALTAASIYQMNSPIKIVPRSNETIEISFVGSFPHISHLAMTGPATKIFEGQIELKEIG